MPSRWRDALGLAVLSARLAGCSADPGPGLRDPDAGAAVDVVAARDLGGVDDVATADRGASVDPAVMCVDTDRDGLSDAVEGPPARDTDGDGTPDFRDTDSDNDGFDDAVEAARRYPGYDDRARARGCDDAADSCDSPADSEPNFRDTDSDNDGLTDREEREARTNPCSEDTDRDGATDLVERVAGSDPRDPGSRPPAESIYVTVPYYPPGVTGIVERREFTFATRVQEADVFLLVDNSASMDPTIAALRSNLNTVIVPGIQRAVRDLRVGVGSFDSMPDRREGEREVPGLDTDGEAGRPGDYTLWVRQPMTSDLGAVQRAFEGMRTIVEDTSRRYLGGDAPECHVEAMYEAIAGTGSRGHEADAAAARSVRNALDPEGNGWVSAVDPMRDCGRADAFGWACFAPGRVPIVVMFSDGAWYDGPLASSPRSLAGHRYAELAAAMNARGALYVGIDVSMSGRGGFTFANSAYLARATGTTDARRQEVIFPCQGCSATGTAEALVSAISTLANETRQSITTVTESAADMRLPTGRAAREFVTGVRPVSGDPEAPNGYERRDETTFYGVSPTARVTFSVSFYNSFVEGGDTAQVFQASIVVRGRAGSEVGRRPLFIVVPARGGGLPPG
ncbi:MAG: hypothetical protein JNK72_23985 [Myxococcales bacterium]|nr:hypothetical protein [Myxococcales bacterium]